MKTTDLIKKLLGKENPVVLGGERHEKGEELHSCVYRKNDVELYHISFKPLSRVLKPKLPDGSELKDETHWSAEPDIPRVCFSETIEGCVRAIYPNISHLAEKHDKLEFYVYKVPARTDGRWVPSWSLVEDGHVWDAVVTKEWWSLSDTKISPCGKVSVSFNTKGDWLTVKSPNGDKIEHSPLDITITN